MDVEAVSYGEACVIEDISRRTLDRRISEGRYERAIFRARGRGRPKRGILLKSLAAENVAAWRGRQAANTDEVQVGAGRGEA